MQYPLISYGTHIAHVQKLQSRVSICLNRLPDDCGMTMVQNHCNFETKHLSINPGCSTVNSVVLGVMLVFQFPHMLNGDNKNFESSFKD